MLTNVTILTEIETRRARTEELLEEMALPAELAELLPAVAEIDEASVESLTAELVKCFGLWADPKYSGGSGDEVYAAAGFEWYYAGDEPPYPVGFGYLSMGRSPAKKTPTKLHLMRDDYLAGSKPDDMVFADCGDFDMETVCGPFYELITSGEFDTDEHEEEIELVENVYLLHLLQNLHLAALEAGKSDEFAALSTTPEFYLLARNHDDLGFIFAALHS